MEITFNGKTYTLRYSFRALMIYENITNKSFNPKGLSDVIVFFYAILVSSAKDTTLSFDDFVEWLDEHPTAINEFSEWLTSVFNHQAGLVNSDIKADEAREEEGKN